MPTDTTITRANDQSVDRRLYNLIHSECSTPAKLRPERVVTDAAARAGASDWEFVVLARPHQLKSG
ncbi:hypothetical protein E3T28_03760 [Cryobacterium sinapicolor]|uniref:Uncharacterized protein n=1 Tax=Cryobacterium sinapicolor TaxID=1259236 RepID=A0ABY2JDM2_9MICO|nr:hypothetical protein [Cryobacterium sinapicolor]TFD03245.1 hypothetical protein E3T28_03760 [Cryobacterium sinapicolor]